MVDGLMLLQVDSALMGLLGAVFFGVLIIIILFLASSTESYQSKSQVSSEVPEGFHRLLVSESQKTRIADSDFASIAEMYRRPIPGVSLSLDEVDSSSSEIGSPHPEEIEAAYRESMPLLHKTSRRSSRMRVSTHPRSQVTILRGGEFIGNRMRFKVKICNDSQYIITDVTIYLLSYPKDALKFVGEDDNVFFSKIEPGGFRSPTFDFLPTQDCVKGEIVAGVSYLDIRGNPQMQNTKPFVIRSVCDLLLPHKISPQDFELKLKGLECGEIVIKVEEWTPEEMFEKALRIVDESNFFEVSSKTDESDCVMFAKIIGFAKGKYTGKEVGVEINISGQTGLKGASCTLRVSGEDQAMILPAIDDLRERLNAWLCPICSSPLTLENVEDLRNGKVIECSFCKVSIGR